MIIRWIWGAGAALMAALGPSPRWLNSRFMHEGGRELPRWETRALWLLQAVFWPAALCLYARLRLYGE